MQAEFRDGKMYKESTWQTVVLIPKGESIIFRGIVLVELIWKAVTSLLNLRITSAIKVYDKLHRFL